jgi:hypothetical protein
VFGERAGAQKKSSVVKSTSTRSSIDDQSEGVATAWHALERKVVLGRQILDRNLSGVWSVRGEGRGVST